MIALVGGHLADPLLGWDGPADVYLGLDGVVAVRRPGEAAPTGEWEARDCRGLLVLPGPIDTLCRLDLDPDPWREGPEALAVAAAAAGYTAVLAHTRSTDPRRVAALAAGGHPVRFHPVAAATDGGGLADMGLLARAGAVAFSDWPAALGDAGRVRQAVAYAGALGRPLVLHAELADLVGGGVAHEGPLSFAMGLRGIPAAAEVAAVARDVAAAAGAGPPPHFAALSAASSLGVLGGASAGVTAHHLALTEQAIRGYRTEAKLSPPLRSEADRLALVAAAREGRLLLASGHASCPPEEKACEYDYASYGGPALEGALSLGLEVLGPLGLAQAASAGPARRFGLPGGTLAPGAPADATVFDPACAWTAGPVSPAAGRRLTGRALLTVVAGRVVFSLDDECIKMR